MRGGGGLVSRANTFRALDELDKARGFEHKERNCSTRSQGEQRRA